MVKCYFIKLIYISNRLTLYEAILTFHFVKYKIYQKKFFFLLGDRIRELRYEKGIALKRLGSVLNTGENIVPMYENSRRTPDYEAWKIAYYFPLVYIIPWRANIKTMIK